MIKAIIVDDEIIQLESLEKLLKKYCTQIEVVASCQNADEAIMKIQELQPQLLLLDISMPGKTGFDLLNAIDYEDKEVIFVTAHNNYMLKAFKYSAIDYILKPVDEDDLIVAVKRAVTKIEEKNFKNNLGTFLYNIQQSIHTPQDMKLCLPTSNGFKVVELNDIIVCIAEGSYTEFILTNTKKVIASRPLIEYEELLNSSSFIRVHKSYLINIKHVTQYNRGEGGTVLMSNGLSVEVSRRKKDYFIEMMKKFFKF